ncbi:MAG: phosphoribosylamine--glycine ligase [Gammaproteobacteria bacterium]|nr:MAG: phosphoribosylamine--glycine ligase [Gammaproteobacteria bacterium]
MRILIVGGGGREHALAWKVAQSPRVSKVFVAPGNPGTAREPKTENVAIETTGIAALLRFAQDNRIDLTIVGPEAPLSLGIVDQFQSAGLRCFGPTQAAAQLEASKSYAKDFMARHRIPTAAYAVFTELDQAVAYIHQTGAPLVIKADGLAAGKGVVIAEDKPAALAAVSDMLSGTLLGAAGSRVVIEEFLTGEEASFIVMADGEHALALASSQDHKRRDDGDQGPNTGGMGAYSPAPVVTPAVHARVLREVIEPALRGMAAEGKPYTGFLYAGLMITPGGAPRVLEFNCRLGDPETQPIMLRLRSDLVTLIEAALDKKLDQVHAEWDERVALGVVLAAQGYPGAYRKGDVIHGLSQASGGKVFHAGTAQQGKDIVTAGGRVLCACALGESYRAAQYHAYQLAQSIRWDGMFYRRDIGARAVARE